MKIFLYGVLCIGAALAADGDSVATARQLATSGKRPEALRILEDRLSKDASDCDARVLHGIILSWEGRYDAARQDLEAVLKTHRDYRDALEALIRVELWSGHPERAEALAREALRRNPRDSAMLLAEAKALHSLGRNREALVPLRLLREFDPGNQEAIRQERDLGDELRSWTATFDQSSEWFSDGRTPWRESQLQLGRQTHMGSLIARFSQANRFSLSSRQVEIDAYPHLRPGTYAYLNFGYSPDANLYPRSRLGAELFQALGHGWEASAGFRQLHFGEMVNVYTASISKYYGPWMFTGRVYLTPGSVGTSRSFQFQSRRYLGGGSDYWGLTYGHGSSLAVTQGLYDLQLLNASSLTTELRRTLNRRLVVQCRFGVSREDRLWANGLRHYLAESYIGYLF